jgi:hypothetical protein
MLPQVLVNLANQLKAGSRRAAGQKAAAVYQQPVSRQNPLIIRHGHAS